MKNCFPRKLRKSGFMAGRAWFWHVASHMMSETDMVSEIIY